VPPFPDPKLDYHYDRGEQIAALRTYRDTKPDRAIPDRAAGRLLLATWNVANLGVQDRTDDDYALIAEIVSWFDLVAIQEVNDNLRGITAIRDHLPDVYRLLFSDASGNLERQAFLFDSTRVAQLEEIGRLSIPPSQLDEIVMPGTSTPFPGFDRGPYLAAFEVEQLRLQLVNVHLFFGSAADADIDRRKLEAYAVGWWADRRHRDKHTYVPNVVPLGDFNLPKAAPGDPIHDALTAKGLVLPPHSSQVGSAIATDNQYDQMAFFTGPVSEHFTGNMNVYDFDGALFADLWAKVPRKDFLAYARFHMSDHRPLWAEFRTA
jgi:endonuclease/exonuclease/phosphatase family metal-dependent hydrolase